MSRWAPLILTLVAIHAAIFIPWSLHDDERGDFVFISAQEHNYLDPQKISWVHDIRVTECLFEPLVRMKLPEVVIEPAAAERWEVSGDGVTYTFHLRPDARWSNGDPVVAGDFVYAWRRALLPDFAADYSELMFRIQGAKEFFESRNSKLKIYLADASAHDEAHARALLAESYADFDRLVGVHALDGRTLVVTLAQPTPYFLDLCQFVTFFPVHPRSVAERETIDPATGMLITDAGYWSDPARLVSNGPYVLASRRFRQDLLMKQNPRYWNRGAMRNRSIRELIIPENPQAALMMYAQGQADWLPDIPSSSVLAADLVRTKREDVLASPWVGTYFYNFNCLATLPGGKPNPLHDPRVRRALSLAIDRQTIVDRVTRIGQPVALTFIPPGSLKGYDPPVEAGSGFDPEQAKKLLAEAGYPGAPGKQLTGISIMYRSGPGHELIAQQISHTWKEVLGISVTLEAVEGKGFSVRLKGEHNYSTAPASWIGDYPDPTTFLDKFRGSNSNNDAGYQSAEFDRLMDEAEAAPTKSPDPAKRLALLRDAEALMLRDQAIAPIYHYITLHVFDPARVKYLYPNVWNYRRLELVEVTR